MRQILTRRKGPGAFAPRRLWFRPNRSVFERLHPWFTAWPLDIRRPFRLALLTFALFRAMMAPTSTARWAGDRIRKMIKMVFN